MQNMLMLSLSDGCLSVADPKSPPSVEFVASDVHHVVFLRDIAHKGMTSLWRIAITLQRHQTDYQPFFLATH